jgi:FtsP/CotA-like multicopper oxidase with cupredoxin domain
MNRHFATASTVKDPGRYSESSYRVGWCGTVARISLAVLGLILVASGAAYGQSLDQVCPRPTAGTAVSDPPELRSSNGILEVTLHLRYQQTLVQQGPPRYCYLTNDGLESPTLRLHPGDLLVIHLHNDLPTMSGYAPAHPKMDGMANDGDCNGTLDPSTTNLHFHGLTVPPTCHQDEVIHTVIPAGKEFEYRVKIPADEPPGVYWYHPHPHGFTERQIQGGASGAIIVEGIEKVDPALASLHQRLIVLRDQQRIGPEAPGPLVPAWDISANFVPVIYPAYQPATIAASPGQREFWRVANLASDTIFNLQILFNHIAQPVEMIAIDGVPIGPRKSTAQVRPTSILLPPGARAEFVVTTPKQGENAQLVTEAWVTGPEGDIDPKRTIANIVTSPEIHQEGRLSVRQQASKVVRAKSRPDTPPVVQRRLYFSQLAPNPQDPDNSVFYFITMVGEKPAAYTMGAPSNVVVHQGDVEEWTVENRSSEDHVFHIHQIHFKVVAVNGKPVNDPTMRDTLDVPFWTGDGPYPSVKLRMDFSDPNVVGTFLYHCHIVKHEDMGMMGSIEVLPPGVAPTVKLDGPSRGQLASLLVFSVEISSRSQGTSPTGTVQFAVDGTSAGRPVPLTNGQARFTTSFEESGIHVLTASYSGNSTYDEALTPPFKITIHP